ncbi:MAG TPA: hypothetical protein VF145_11440, partial [Chitinophagaceae bacterium]
MGAYLAIFAGKVTLRNLIEILFVAATILWYRRLRRIELQALLPVTLCLLLVDSFVSKLLPIYLHSVSLVEFSCVVFGLISFKRMGKSGMTVLITLTFIDLILDLAAVEFANNGIFNLFIINFYFFVSVPIWYYFFFLHL